MNIRFLLWLLYLNDPTRRNGQIANGMVKSHPRYTSGITQHSLFVVQLTEHKIVHRKISIENIISRCRQSTCQNQYIARIGFRFGEWRLQVNAIRTTQFKHLMNIVGRQHNEAQVIWRMTSMVTQNCPLLFFYFILGTTPFLWVVERQSFTWFIKVIGIICVD